MLGAIRRHRANRQAAKRLKAKTRDARNWIDRVEHGEASAPLGVYEPSGTSGYALTDALKGPTRYFSHVLPGRPPVDESPESWDERPLMTPLAEERVRQAERLAGYRRAQHRREP